MLLALDLGNSSLSVGVFDGERLIVRTHVPVIDFGTLAQRLSAACGDIDTGDINRAALASVNPKRDDDVVEAVAELPGACRLVKIGKDLAVPVNARVARIDEVGVDRLLNALAAFRRERDACLVVDFGSAVTIDVVSETGDYLGGVIAPGVRIAADALHKGTALLPKVDLGASERVIGKDTVACMRSGLYWGTVGAVEGLVARVRGEYPAAKRVLATGGDARLFADVCTVIDEVVPELTLEGIRLTVAAGDER